MLERHDGMDFTRCLTRPRFARNDEVLNPSLRGVFDVAIHLHDVVSQSQKSMDCRASLAMTNEYNGVIPPRN
jgi:hypothetical protein